MTRDVPPDFQARIDTFNDAQGGPARIAMAWDIRAERWRVYAVPVYDSTHALARNSITRQLLRPFCDESGRQGVPLFFWDDPLDERLFTMLRWADSFSDRQHFEKAVEGPEQQREAQQSRRWKDALNGAREYWSTLDRTLVPTNPNVASTGDWRAKQSFR